MKITLNITPNSVSIGKETLSKDLYEQIALHSKVIDKSKPGKLVVEFDKKKPIYCQGRRFLVFGAK